MISDDSSSGYQIEFQFCADLETGVCEFEVISGTPSLILQILADHADDGLLAFLARGAVDDFCAFLEYCDEEPESSD